MRQLYETQSMFPIRCFSFKAPDGMNADVKEAVKKLEYRNYNAEYGVGTSSSILKHPDFFYLHEWFQCCIDTLHIDNGWNCDRIVINKSWVNRSDAGTGHHHAPHRHPMSFLSAIYYLTEGPATQFIDPLSQREWAQLHLDGAPITDSTQFIHPRPGGLFIFPSYMIHASEPNFETTDRYSIAFNTFPQGNINMGGWDESMLNIEKVEGWSDLGPLNISDYCS